LTSQNELHDQTPLNRRPIEGAQKLGSLLNPETAHERKLLDIVKAAAEVFREHGFEAGTLEDVADRLGITRPALYHYIDSKQELLAVTLNYLLDLGLAEVAIIEQREADPLSRLRSLIISFITMIGSERSLFTVLFRDEAVLDEPYRAVILPKERRYVDYFQRAISDAMKAEYLPAIPETLATMTILGACIWTYTWLDPVGKIPLEQSAAMIAEFLTTMRSLR
jgi:TetR/AcrR family transcriptional regulator, cholesterol catabolism regulator